MEPLTPGGDSLTGAKPGLFTSENINGLESYMLLQLEPDGKIIV